LIDLGDYAPPRMIARHKPKSEIDKTGADAVREKFERLVSERNELKDRWHLNTAALKDTAIAARLFGTQIDLPADIHEPLEKTVASPLAQPARPTFRTYNFKATPGHASIRERVLDLLRAAGEKGAKASQLQPVIEGELGRKLHYKTIGMTLYRLSEKGLAERVGYTWFYVPQKNSPGAASTGA